jgi:DNA polymerase I-like protein with 3'-5' exonuclease and polymerase domains
MFTRYKIIRSFKELKQLVEACLNTGYASVDFETNAEGIYKDTFKPTILSVSFQVGSGCSIPLQHFDESVKDIPWLKWLQYFGRKVVENPKVVKVAQNFKFDNQIFVKYGIYVRGTVIDTMLAKYLLNEEKPHGLKPMVAKYLPEFADYEKYDKFETIPWDKKPLEPLARYGCMDTDFTLRLALFLEKKLIDKGFYNLYRNLIMPASKVLQDAETNGLPIDLSFNDFLQDKYSKLIQETNDKLRSVRQIKRYQKYSLEQRKQVYIDKLTQEIEELSGDPKKAKSIKNREDKISRILAGEYKTNDEKKLIEPINFNSTKQMVDLLYLSPKGFKFPVIEYTKDKKNKPTSNPSTSEDTLLKILDQDKSGFIKALLDLRGLDKMNSTYIVGLRELVQSDNKVHPTFLISGTTSGRLSSRNPNGQNIPKVMVNPDIKKQFIPPFGKLFLTYDYSQAELRILAHLANEETMLEWFRTGKDIHLASACKKYHEDYDKIIKIYEDEQHELYPLWKKRRKQAKTLNFGVCFSGDTEILTEKGWQRFDVLDKTLKVAQYNQDTTQISFVTPQKYIEYQDQELWLHESKCTNICATSNHRLLFKKLKYRPYNEITVGEVNGLKGYSPSAGLYKGNYIDDRYTRLIAIIASDGNFFRPGRFRFCFKKERKIERFEWLLNNQLNIKYTKRVTKRYTTFHIDLRGTEYDGIVEKYLSPNKDLSIDAIHDLNGGVYLDEAFNWDGTQIYKTHSKVYKFSTKSETTANIMQIFGILNNKRITLTKIRNLYRIHWRESEHSETYVNWSFNKVPNKQSVYCVQVPDSNIIVRRNGRVLITKNCYEQTAVNLSKTLETSQEEAQKFLDEFFDTFPKIKKFMDKQHKFMEKHGYCVSLFGRRRRCPKVYSDNYGEYLEALRQSTNAPVQSAASDMALFASIIVWEQIKKGELPPMKEVNTVHDSVYQFIEPRYITPDTVYKLWDICRNPSTKEFFGFEIKDVNMSMDFTVGRTMAEELPYIPGYDYNKMLSSDFDIDEYYSEHKKVMDIQIEKYPKKFKSYFEESWRKR